MTFPTKNATYLDRGQCLHTAFVEGNIKVFCDVSDFHEIVLL